MNKLTIKVISALGGVIIFFACIVLFQMTGEYLNDLAALVIWFGSVGLIITFIYGIPVSFLLEWILKKMKLERGLKYNTVFITLHVLAGTLVPVLGNIVSFFFAVTHLLLEKENNKHVLFFLVCAVFLVTAGFMLDVKLQDSSNMNLDGMTQFFVLFGIGFIVIWLSSFWFIRGKTKWKLLVTVLSFCIVFLPCIMYLFNVHQDFKTKYDQEKVLAELYDGVEKQYPDFELDLLSSFENGETLDLTIYKRSTGVSAKSIEEFIDFLPKRKEGYFLQIYEEEEYLILTIDSDHKVTECEHINAKNSICNEF